MRKLVLIFIITISLHNAAAQEQEMQPMTYTVKMGETVRMISKKFRIAPSEIYRLNRFAIEGVKEGMVLHLLVPRKEESVQEQVVQSEAEPEVESSQSPEEAEIKHTVGPQETLYSLSKKYNVSVEEIRKRNEKILKKGLQAGQVLTISNAN